MSTKPLLALRCSGLPLNFKCPGSARPPVLKIRSTSEPAELGITAHQALQSVARGDGVPWDELGELAKKEGVDTDELRILVATGAKLWAEVEGSFPAAQTEVEYGHEFTEDGFALTGHADIQSLAFEPRRVGRGADWKTGRWDADHSWQVKGYALLAMLKHELEESTGTVLWVRDKAAENYTLTEQNMWDVVAAIRQRVVEWDGTHEPGAHCKFCPRAHECDARFTYEHGAIQTFSKSQLKVLNSDALAPLSDDQRFELYNQAKRVLEIAEMVKDAMRNWVKEHGPIVAQGRKLDVVNQERVSLDPLKAWSVLEEAGFEPDDLAACVTLGLTKVKDVTAKKAGRGKGAQAILDIMSALESANAVTKTTTERFSEGRI